MNISAVSRPWTVTPEQRNGLAWQGRGHKPVDIVNGFNVSEGRFAEFFDCTTHAAVIKMMMMTFGQSPADMFERITPSANGYEITMKDEFKVHVSRQELQQAARASRFAGGDPELVDSANFVFAAFVKRKQSTGGHASFEAALAKTLKGETSLRCLQGMGVYGMARYVAANELVGKDTVAVAEGTNMFSGALVRDGVKHIYGSTRRVGHEYVFQLFNDKTRTDSPSKLHTNAVVSEATVGTKPQDIWSGFYQGVEGNCVTVSAIKAAMMRFGQNPAGIYRQINATPDGYAVIMRDGFKLRLSHDELDQAKRGSNFFGRDQQMLNDANFLYAASAKRAQLENNDFRANQSFKVAMDTLNDGEWPGKALRRLGLFAYVRESDARELAGGAIGTLASSWHSVVVVNGVLDFYGEKRGLASSSWMNTGLRALKLV